MPTPNSYKDAFWSDLASSVESKLDIPQGLLSSILTKGERSNNDQVSEKGARTPFQIIPQTRKAAIDKYGIDPYLSPENAAEVAGRLLKDSLKRNNGDASLAVAEYHGGTDRKNWGPKTKAYVGRVVGGNQPTDSAQVQPTDSGDSEPSTYDQVKAERAGKAEESIASVYQAYKSGQMTPEKSARFEQLVNSGSILLPRGATLNNQAQDATDTSKPADVQTIPQSVLDAYYGGDMPREKKIALEQHVKDGTLKLPQGVKLDRTEPLGFFGKVKEAVTGEDRATSLTRSLPEWTSMPELSQLSAASAKTGLGTMFASTDEAVKIIQANNPDVQVRQDTKGNYILKSGVDGKEYAIPPGFSWGDIPRAIGSVAAFTPAAKATTIAGAALANAGTQAVIEGTQAATGGEFNPGEVATAGVIGAAVPAASRVTQAAKPVVTSAVNKIKGGQAPLEESIAASSTKSPYFKEGVDIPQDSWYHNLSQENKDLVMEDLHKATAPSAAPEQAIAEVDVAKLVKKASSDGMGSTKAKEDLAALAKINPEAQAAANKLKMDLPHDIFSDNAMYKEVAGLSRSIQGSEASAAWKESIERAAKQADEAMKSLDATENLASVSDRVKSSLGRTRSDLEAAARTIYDKVDAAIPKDTPVELPNLTETLKQITKEVGPDGLSTAEKRLASALKLGNRADGELEAALAKMSPSVRAMNKDVLASAAEESGPITYGRLQREKSLIGKAMEGKESPYGNMESGALKRLYRALADDQLQAVETVAGKETRDTLRYANQLTAMRKGLEERIVKAFGTENDGSIANAIRNSINAASRGDEKQLTKLLKVVPEDMRKEVLASAIRSAAGNTKAEFGFGGYEKLYRNLRKNAGTYSKIVKELGPESHKILNNLYIVARRINEAQSNILTTGKANQALVGPLMAESLTSKVLGSTAGRAGAAVAGAVGGGPVGAGLMSALTSALASGKRNVVKEVGNLLVSPEYEALVKEVAKKGEASPKSVKRLARSEAFTKFFKQLNEPQTPSNKEQWILRALQSENNRDN